MRSAIIAAVLLAFAASSSFALELQAPGNSGQQPTGLGRSRNPQNDRAPQDKKNPPQQQQQPAQQQQQSGDSREKKQDRRQRDDR